MSGVGRSGQNVSWDADYGVAVGLRDTPIRDEAMAAAVQRRALQVLERVPDDAAPTIPALEALQNAMKFRRAHEEAAEASRSSAPNHASQPSAPPPRPQQGWNTQAHQPPPPYSAFPPGHPAGFGYMPPGFGFAAPGVPYAFPAGPSFPPNGAPFRAAPSRAAADRQLRELDGIKHNWPNLVNVSDFRATANALNAIIGKLRSMRDRASDRDVQNAARQTLDRATDDFNSLRQQLSSRRWLIQHKITDARESIARQQANIRTAQENSAYQTIDICSEVIRGAQNYIRLLEEENRNLPDL